MDLQKECFPSMVKIPIIKGGTHERVMVYLRLFIVDEY